ncbi:MAG: TetR/AcrR family transcriptional regulator [Terracidiphilus sp.]
MPKIAKQRAEQNRTQIEQAALSLFTRQGFHGTNIRDIAELAQVSTGAIYTYFPTKDALFESVVHSYEKRIGAWRAHKVENLGPPFSKRSLETLAREVRSFVFEHADYWKLMYIDVVEFNNRHFAHSFHNVPEQFKWRMDAELDEVSANPAWCGIDPGFVLATIYLQILTYFLVERLFSGNQHLGVSDDTVIQRIIDLALNGIWRKGQSGQSSPAKSMPAGNRNRLGKPNKRKKQNKRNKTNRVAGKSTLNKTKSRKPGNSIKEK